MRTATQKRTNEIRLGTTSANVGVVLAAAQRMMDNGYVSELTLKGMPPDAGGGREFMVQLVSTAPEGYSVEYFKRNLKLGDATPEILSML